MTRTKRSLFLCTIGCLALMGGWTSGDDAVMDVGTGESFVQDVVRMLEQGLDSSLVLAWFGRQEKPPESVSADDMLRLHEAGASAELIRAILDPGGQPRAARPTAPSAAIDSVPSAPVPALPAALVSDKPNFDFSITYKPFSENQRGDPPWDLYVYLDGDVLTWMNAERPHAGRPVDFEMQIPPGKHTIRVLQERHVRRGKHWRHEARVCPEAIPLEVGAGSDWSLSLSWVEKTGVGPLSWSLSFGDRRVAHLRESGTSKHEWKLLCDDLEANSRDGKKASRRVQRELESCVRWASLWNGAFPERIEVRAAMERHGYRPVPAPTVSVVTTASGTNP